MRNGRHVGAIGLEHDALKGYCGRQVFGQMALLEREHTANAQHEAVEGEQLASLDLVAREAMEHAARQVALVAAQNLHHLVLSLPTVNHQWQARLHRPAHLLLKGLQLLLLELAAPIEVEAYLADG